MNAITFDIVAPDWFHSLDQSIQQKINDSPKWLREKVFTLGEDGFNNHLMGVCRSLANYQTLSREEIFKTLRACADSYSRPVADSEIQKALHSAYDKSAARPAIKWPDYDSAAVEEIHNTGKVQSVENLAKEYGVEKTETPAILNMLFPSNSILCLGIDQANAETKHLIEWAEEDLQNHQFIVPSPMSALTGKTKQGKTSSRCLDNTGQRLYLVLDFDKGTPEQQAASVNHLSKFAPLVMVVNSGNKSLHAWFECRGEPEEKLKTFMRYAVSLGADPATWTRCQYVRTPGAIRQGEKGDGNHQEVVVFCPTIADLESWNFDEIPHMNQPGSESSFPLKHISEISLSTKANDFVEKLLTTGGVSVVYGESNSGKSFWALSLAACVASGEPWRDRAVEQGAVIYICLEGERGVQNRIELLKRENKINDSDPFHILPVAVNFLHKEDREKLVSTVQKLADQEALPVRLIIVDTLSRAMPGGNENGVEDMTELIATVDAVKNKTEAHVMLIHHCGKDAARGARGHSSLRAAVDTEIELVHDKQSKISTATVTKQRDLEGGNVFPFRLSVFNLGFDDKDRDITSCLVKHLDESEAPAKPIRGRKPKYQPHELLELLPQANVTSWKNAAKDEIGMSHGKFYDLKKELIEGDHYTKNETGEIITTPATKMNESRNQSTL